MKKRIILLSILILLIVLEIIILKNITNEKEEINKIYLDINDKLVIDLYNMANPSLGLLNDLYKNDKLTNQYILAVGINNYIKNNLDNDITYIKEEDIRNNIKYTLGNINYNNEDILLYIDNCYYYIYNNELKHYKKEDNCIINNDEKYYREIIGAYKINNKLFIEERIIYMTFDKNKELNKVSIFTSPDMLNVLDYIETKNYDDIDFNNYIDKGNVYQYEFEKIDNNNNYIFKGIKKI